MVARLLKWQLRATKACILKDGKRALAGNITFYDIVLGVLQHYLCLILAGLAGCKSLRLTHIKGRAIRLHFL